MSVKWYGDRAMHALNDANEAGLLAVVLDIEGSAKLLSPWDTGRLRGSITYRTTTREDKPRPPAKPEDGVQSRPKKGEAYIGTNVEYAAHQEFGTVKMKAQSFLRKAVDTRRSIAPGIFAQTFRRVMARYK